MLWHTELNKVNIDINFNEFSGAYVLSQQYQFGSTHQRWSRKRRTLCRLPQTFMSHQRRVRLRVVSRKSHAHEASAHGRTREMASVVNSSTAARITGARIASTSGASPAESNISSSRFRPERSCACEKAAPRYAFTA